VLGDALRPARPVVLLLEDQPLDKAGVAAAVLPRPRDDGPAGVEQLPLPLHVQGEPLGRVARRQAIGDVGLEPGPGLGPERLLLVGVGEIHYFFRMTQEPWPKRPWLTVRPTDAPSTWRPSACPRSCQATSHTWARAWAGTASPKQERPPLGLTGIRPPMVVSPSCSRRSASPGLHRPTFSYQSSSRADERS